MSCANCGVPYLDTGSKVDNILCTWNGKVTTYEVSEDLKLTEVSETFGHRAESKTFEVPHEDESGQSSKESKENTTSSSPDHPNQITVLEALSIIFEVPPLTSRSATTNTQLKDSVKVFRNPSGMNNEDESNELKSGETKEDNPLSLCVECAETLTVLYNSFKGFTQICKLECEIAKRLQELENLSQNVSKTNTFEDIGYVDGKRKRRKIQRKRKVTAPPPPSIGKRGRGRPRKRPKVEVVEVLVKEEGEFEIVKGNYCQDENADMDSDMESDFEGRDYYGYSSESSSPPDSPINLDPNEIPRSPRPVRTSSARNKDWSSYYKDDLLDDVVNENNDSRQDQEGETETDATFTEAEVEAVEEEVPDSDSILENVEVNVDEERDRNLELEEDDDDEEYRPDSDLEELMSAAEESRSKTKRPKPKYHSRPRRTSVVRSRSRPIQNRPRLIEDVAAGDFECTECGKLFAYKKSYERHKRTHNINNDDVSSVTCPTCNKVFSREDHLLRHRRLIHSENIPSRKKIEFDLDDYVDQRRQYECPVCHILFPKIELQEHVDDHDVPNPWKCAHCPQEFSTFADFSTHRTNSHSERQKATCSVCEKVFRSNYHMKRHQIAIHCVRADKPIPEDTSSDDENVDGKPVLDQLGNVIHSGSIDNKKPKYKCHECGKRYFGCEKLTEHLILHGIGERYKCEICGREFNHERSKQRHMLLHSEDCPHKCTEEDCDKTFTRKDHLVNHLKSRHGIAVPHSELVMMERENNEKKKKPKDKELPCPHCNKIVKRERMRLHLVSHTGEKRHVCEICGSKFGLRTTLLTHIQCVHQDVRRYTCEHCDRAFKRSNHLKDHLKLHTAPDNKPFVCELCAKSFRREKNLKSHMVTHLGGKDYMCEQCGKAFNRIDNMRAHVKVVHQGLQIRKKKSGQSTTRNKQGTALHNFDTTEEHVIMDLAEHPDGTQISIPHGTFTSSTPSTSTSSVIVTVKKPPGRKRGPKGNKVIARTIPLSTLLNSAAGNTDVPIMTLTVDPNGISGDNLGSVQIQEIHEAEDGDPESGSQFDQQRTTIVQLAPGQVFPANASPFSTATYYQYTYYHPS